MTGSTIDLGVLPPAGQAGGPPPAPASGWPRRPVAWVAGVLGVLLLLTTTASVPPRPPWAVPLFTVPAGEYVEQGGITLTEDTLYVHGWRPDEQATLAAYRLSDGELLWQEAAYQVEAWQGKPVVEESGHTLLLDAETGLPRWQGEGHLAAVVDDRMLIQLAEPEWQGSLTALDRQTAREVWRLPAADGWAYAATEDGRPGRLVTADGGRLSSYDLATGALLATVEASALPPHPVLRVLENVVLVRADGPQPALYAYQLETLQPLWAMEFAHELWDMSRCGELACIQGGGWAGLNAVDPLTGERRWSGPWLAEVILDAQWLPGYLIASETDGTSDEVIDAATGEVVMELDPWRPFYHDGDGPVGLVTRYDPNRQQVVVQLDANRRAVRFREAGRTWFARMHPDTTRLEVLGFVAGGIDGCDVTVGYLACESHGTVQVWRLR